MFALDVWRSISGAASAASLGSSDERAYTLRASRRWRE
jgi:hypothetical protein